MKFLLDKIGNLFVYRSPQPLDGYRSYLKWYPNWWLRQFVGTTHDYNKSELVEMIIAKKETPTGE